ncbi:MAG: hypothetical protein QOI57_3154 [Rubrobacteraceae bacterium]|nr:hypothetical protein [Rubrobacteraceae bacterium]
MSYVQPQSILSVVTGNWWVLALRGVLAVLFGLLALIAPIATLTVLVLFWGAFALVDGIFAIVAAFRVAGGRGRWWLIIEGVLGILAGIVTFLYPGLTALVLLYIIAFWAILIGVMRIVTAISLRREIENEWLMILGGVLSVIFGILLIVLPGPGLLSLTWLIGIWALIFGIALIALAFRVRNMGQAVQERRVR